MVWGLSSGLMGKSMRDSIKMGSRLARGYSLLLMAVFIRASLPIVKFMALASTSGRKIASMLASGSIIKCMAMGASNGLMAGNTKGSTKMIKNMAMELLSGLMGGSTPVSGKMENNMAKATTF